MAIAASSPGGLGGMRVLVPLRMLFGNLGVHVVPSQVSVNFVTKAFDENGMLSELQNDSNDLDITSRYRYAQPILFVERGVEFLIFADGSFDFNTEIFYDSPRDVYYKDRRNRRSRNYGAPGHGYGRSNRGTLVRHDRFGRVRRIGNVFINYDLII